MLTCHELSNKAKSDHRAECCKLDYVKLRALHSAFPREKAGVCLSVSLQKSPIFRKAIPFVTVPINSALTQTKTLVQRAA
jgi:hypothetical protein